MHILMALMKVERSFIMTVFLSFKVWNMKVFAIFKVLTAVCYPFTRLVITTEDLVVQDLLLFFTATQHPSCDIFVQYNRLCMPMHLLL